MADRSLLRNETGREGAPPVRGDRHIERCRARRHRARRRGTMDLQQHSTVGHGFDERTEENT